MVQLTPYLFIQSLEHNDALERFGPPEIVNTDQGSQFTSESLIHALTSRNIRISMDGKGRWKDNVFIERFWKTVNYEEVCLRGYESLSVARRGLKVFMDYYNSQRGHQSFDYKTPDEVYWTTVPEVQVAA